MKLLFATGNDYKFNLMKNRLRDIDSIELVSPKMLGININVEENGSSAIDNAFKKAKAYYDITHLPTIAEDSGLYIDKFKSHEQPGLFVKRINGKEDLTDEEILNYYIKKLENYNGRSLAHYFTGVCIIGEDGSITSDTIEETDFLLTSKRSKKVNLNGGILEPISFDLDCEKYFDERNQDEIDSHYKELDDNYKHLIKRVLIKNN